MKVTLTNKGLELIRVRDHNNNGRENWTTDTVLSVEYNVGPDTPEGTYHRVTEVTNNDVLYYFINEDHDKETFFVEYTEIPSNLELF